MLLVVCGPRMYSLGTLQQHATNSNTDAHAQAYPILWLDASTNTVRTCKAAHNHRSSHTCCIQIAAAPLKPAAVLFIS